VNPLIDDNFLQALRERDGLLHDIWREVGPGFPSPTDGDSYLPPELVERIGLVLGKGEGQAWAGKDETDGVDSVDVVDSKQKKVATLFFDKAPKPLVKAVGKMVEAGPVSFPGKAPDVLGESGNVGEIQSATKKKWSVL
jgi:hypothetical protein